jgi:hypothetical protein
MPMYPLFCANCGEVETFASMKTARANDKLPCPICGRPRPRRIVVFQHQEDRTHFWKGPMGNGYSTALGEFMPASRQERDRLARKKGVEFCTLADLRADNKEAADALDYSAHVAAGGKRDDPPNPAPADVWKEPPK